MCQKRGWRSLPPAPSSTRLAAGIEPTPPGTKQPCTSSILRYRCGNITTTKPTTTLYPVCMAGRRRSTTAANQKQQPFMRCSPAPAPSPPRFATARQDVEARRDAGPPCTFRYARPILTTAKRQRTNTKRQSGGFGMFGVTLPPPPPPGVRTHLCGTEEGRAVHCTTTRCYHRARITLHTQSAVSVPVQHPRISYGV